MRILIYNWKDLSHPAAGGAEVLTEEVARVLVRRGHSVTIFAAAVTGWPERENVQGVDIIRRGSRLGVYGAAKRFWADEGKGKYDVVIDEINTRPFLTPRWIRDVPVVALIHQLAREIWFDETPFPVAVLGRYVLEPWWLRAYRDVPAVTVSQSSAQSLERHHGWRDITIIPEGYTPHALPDVAKEEEPTLVFLGRLVSMKRPQDALEALRLLRDALPTARLWLIGEGPLLEELRTRRQDGAEFLGRLERTELLERLARAHVLVATSVREGWGLGVSEAAACGTPTIGYSVPGLVDSIPASGGALVPTSPAALANAIGELFAGRLELQPHVSTVPWSDVATRVEARLLEVVEAWSRDRATSRSRGQARTKA